MAKQPQLLGYTALLGDNSPIPSKWERLKAALWESNLNAPVRGAYNLMNTPYEVLAGGPSPEFDAAVGNSFDAAGGITVGSMPMPKPANSLSMGIKAYHASPHLFDRFEWSPRTRGTGEGAQAYGDGLYFAEHEPVAIGYRHALAPGMGSENLKAAGVSDSLLRSLPQFTKSAVDPDVALRDWLGWSGKKETPEIRDAFMKDWAAKNDGHMYEVNIDADPNTFLDWDKPLSEQPEAVRKATAAALAERGLPLGPDGQPLMLQRDPRGEMVNASLTAFGDAKNTPELLAKHGIPGIKYLDAGSRGAGDGTRNYVVFDDKLISIVRKYGIAGASAMLGYNLLENVDKAQATTLKEADLAHQYDNWKREGGI